MLVSLFLRNINQIVQDVPTTCAGHGALLFLGERSAGCLADPLVSLFRADFLPAVVDVDQSGLARGRPIANDEVPRQPDPFDRQAQARAGTPYQITDSVIGSPSRSSSTSLIWLFARW